MMSRGFMKLFHRQNSEKERIEYVDESINQLVQDFMDCDNVNKRKYENELKDAINFRSNITDEPFKNPCAEAIINGDNIGRAMIDNETSKFYIDFIPTNKNISKTYNKLLRKNINISEKNTGVEIKESSLLLKCLMLITLYMLNTSHHNNDYEFILNKNKVKKLNERIKAEFK